MSTLLTSIQLKTAMPACREPDLWAPCLDTHLFAAGIVEPRQIAHFVSQTGHESVNYNVLQENLNYSADGLKSTFGKYFRDVDPYLYARNPEKIANRVYANRMDNGSEESGDGWRFRGRGILQVTGRYNYGECSQFIFGDRQILWNDPDMLLEKEYALRSALWYWEKNRLKRVDDVGALTKAINGGLHGLEDRKARFEKALKAFTV